MKKNCLLCGKEFETILHGEKRQYCFECSPKGKHNVITILRRRAKEIGVERLGGRCKKCGIDKRYLLEFHHRNPVEKDSELSDLAKGYDLTKFFEELSKCDLLCANCHREFHWFNYSEGTTYEEWLNS